MARPTIKDLKDAVESASNFMGVGSELRSRGIKYDFVSGDPPIPPHYVAVVEGKRYGIANKKYTDEADFVVGDIAVGKMASDKFAGLERTITQVLEPQFSEGHDFWFENGLRVQPWSAKGILKLLNESSRIHGEAVMEGKDTVVFKSKYASAQILTFAAKIASSHPALAYDLLAIAEKQAGVQTRPISDIAREIRQDWKDVYFGAKPYLEAMEDLDKVTDYYGADSAKSIVLYFLTNATRWKGPKAKAIKDELKKMVK